MRYVVTPKQAKSIDAYMMQQQGIPGVTLMERAASGVTACVMRVMPKDGRVLILCGGGNNGGDGLAVLRQLCEAGVYAHAALLTCAADYTGDAKHQYDRALALQLPMFAADTPEQAENIDFSGYAVVVDAIFGTGLSRPIQGTMAALITRLNECNTMVIAVDIPSGIDGATGKVCGTAVKAAYTVTFQYIKVGHLFYPGRAHCGELEIAPLGDYTGEQPDMRQLEEADIQVLLPERSPDSHKGSHGKALLIAGSREYSGAAVLAASSLTRGGAGISYAAVPQALCYAMTAVPAAICHPCGEGDAWDTAASQDAMAWMGLTDAIAIGPGIGSGEGIPALIFAALDTKKPLLLDADALNAMAKERSLIQRLHAGVVLTPHPGEMAKLLHQTIGDITADPIRTAKEAAAEWGCTVLLKGAVSVIASSDGITLNATGNDGLAKGGSGDVLTGLILSFMAQGLSPYDAASAGAYIMGQSADRALAMLGTRMLAPMDVTEAIERMLAGY